MTNLLAVALMAGLWLAVKALWSPPSWLGWLAERVAPPPDDGEEDAAADDWPGEADKTTVEWGLLSQPFLQRRLDALADELERLDRDPDVFAKAFHTAVARSAHQALLADASRLVDQPPVYSGQPFRFELARPTTGPREELEL